VEVMRALVLRKIPFGESDLILRFLLETGEVISAFAAGGRNSKKRFPHQFNPTGLYDLDGGRKEKTSKLSRISKCDLIDFKSEISDSMEVFCRWAIVLEWISLDEENGFDFEEILNLRETLSQNLGFYFQFFLQQMKLHGLHPELEKCVICQACVKDRIIFHFEDGGVAHSHCADGEDLSRESLNFIAATFREAASPDLSAKSIREFDRIILPFLEWQLGRRLKTQKVFADAFLKTRSFGSERSVSFAP
jgi:DNA repair protein RecO